MKTTWKTTKRLLSILLCVCMMLSVLPTASLSASASEYPTITPGVGVTFELNETTTAGIYAFTPEESGVYRFYTYDSTRDTYGYLLDADGNVLAEDDDGANSGNNFLIAYEMTVGTTYLLKAQFYTVGAEGSMTMILEKAAAPTAVTIDQGDTYSAYPVGIESFMYTLEPAGSATVGATWTSDDPNIIEMTEDGYARFMAPGTATVTVTTAEGLTDTCEVTVLDPLPLKAGETVTATCELHYDVTYSFIPEKTATYAFFTESEQYIPYAELRYTNAKDLMVLDYDDNQQDHEFRLQCELTAGEEYYLFVTGQLLDATFDVTAEEVVPATAMILNHTTLDVHLGGSLRLRPVYTPTNAIYETITWESSDDTVVSVDGNGAVSFLKEGTAIVTATSENGFTASCAITVGGYPTISLCKTETFNIGVGGNAATYLFTPEKSGNYAFYAASDYDTLGYIYDVTGETLLYNNDDYDGERDFRVEATLEAGVTYQLKGTFYYDSQIGVMDLTVVRIDGDGNVIHDVSEYVVTDDSHSGVCDGCGETVSGAHAYDENGLCVCGRLHIHTSTDYSYDNTTHWGNCDLCGEGIEENHTLDENNTCKCGYFEHDHEGIFSYGADYHWGDCTVCNEYINEEHAYDENGDCRCGWFVHLHGGDTYDYDGSGHWLACSQCGMEVGGWEEHYYDEYGECVCGDVIVYGVYFGNTFVGNYEYLDLNGNVTDEAPTGGYAYYEDGVLTLHNFSFTGWGAEQTDTTCLVYAETELEIVLEGNNSLHSLYGDGMYVSGADLTIDGDGTLTIKADGDFDGIDVSGGKLKINSGTLNIDASDHGIEVEGDFRVYGGTITVVAGDDGFDIDGDVRINGGVIDIDAEDNGIDAYYDVYVEGGSVTITSTQYAVRAYGELLLNNNISMIAPENGAIGRGDDHSHIVTEDGAIALEVQLQERPFSGVYEEDGVLYYVNYTGVPTAGKHYVTEVGGNGYVTQGYIYTDENGRLYDKEIVTVDGVTYYFEGGKPASIGGVTKIDGELYYISWRGIVQTGTIWVSNGNGYVAENTWAYADENGRLYHNEFVSIDGNLYYMEYGQPCDERGITEIDGEYYYISWKGIVQVGKVWAMVTNDYLPTGWYYTDENGCFV